ncbi:MAG: RNA polymerase factor sigma-54 [Planctomycetota bacterium]
MRLGAELGQRAEQRLALGPRMLQCIEVLQLASADLAELVAVELESNALLEDLRPPEAEVETPPVGAGDAAPTEDVAATRRGSEDDAKLAFLQNLADPSGPSLLAHLREQLAWRDVSAELAGGVLALAELLDERGYLRADEAELRGAAGPAPLPEALALLQSLEPRGLGARSAIEALLLQVPPDDPDYPDIRLLLTEHLDALAANKLPEVARVTGRSVAEIEGLLQRIRRLDPRPGAQFIDAPSPGVRPDLVVHHEGDRVLVRVADGTIPELGINAEYAALLDADSGEADVQSYLRPRLDAARDLLWALEQRRATLLRVGQAVMDHQRDFLNAGEGAIRPLRMADVAAVVELHASTVSRAVAGKWVQTARGVFPLRSFFDGRHAAAGAEAPGRRALQSRLKELVQGEDPMRPWSDDDLAVLLARGGAHVARRTVAKYRRDLGIPSSWRRRRHRTQP